MNKNAKATYELLDNLLIWSQNQTGKLKCEKEHMNISTIIEEIIKLLTGNAERKGISIINNVDSHVIVYCDKNTVKTIIVFMTSAP